MSKPKFKANSFNGDCVNERIVLYTNYFNFFIFIHFTNQKTLKSSLARMLKLIFEFSTI